MGAQWSQHSFTLQPSLISSSTTLKRIVKSLLKIPPASKEKAVVLANGRAVGKGCISPVAVGYLIIGGFFDLLTIPIPYFVNRYVVTCVSPRHDFPEWSQFGEMPKLKWIAVNSKRPVTLNGHFTLT